MDDDAATLEVGAQVSAKYRGAWCEGKVKAVQFQVQFKVEFAHEPGKTLTLEQAQVRSGTRPGDRVEAQNPANKRFMPATIVRVFDKCTYLIRFNDGDERKLRRRAVTRKGPAHFDAANNLDNFPITDPTKLATPPSGRRRRLSLDDEDKGDEDDASDANSAASDKPEHPSGSLHDVVLVQPANAKEPMWAAVVVPWEEAPSWIAEEESHDEKKALLVRFFADSSFGVVERDKAWILKRGVAPFAEQLQRAAFQADPAVNRALYFLDEKELPAGFEWPDWNLRDEEQADSSDDEAGSGEEDEEWDPDPADVKAFHNELLQHHTKAGTTFNEHPVLGFRDLNLFRLYTLVDHYGGSSEVSKLKLWRNVYEDMGFEPRSTGANSIRAAFEKFDHRCRLAAQLSVAQAPVGVRARQEPCHARCRAERGQRRRGICW